MNFPEHYLFNVALHATGLSILVFVAILFMRKPQRVAVAALSGLLAIAILPWFSAWRTGEKTVERSKSDPVSVSPTALPQWTVIRIPAARVQESAVAVTAEKPMALPGPDILLAYGWAAGGVVLLVGLAIASLRIVYWRRSLHPMEEEVWCRLPESLRDVPSRHSFRISSGSGSPCVAGFFRPLIVVPAYLLEHDKERELRWALRHELRHWRGGDSRWTMILELIRAIHWWNPVVHLLIARWKITREFICDLSAAENDEDRSTYGEFLIAMASRQTSRNPLAVTMVRKLRLKVLRSRIVSILDATPGSGTPFEKGVLLSACCGLLGAALLISGVRIGSDLSTSSEGGEFSGVQDNPFGGMAFAEDEPRAVLSPGGKVLQLKIQTKSLVTPGKIAEHGSIRNDAEMQMLMREISQTRGSMLSSFSTITAREGETTAMEMIRENPANRPWRLDMQDPKERPEGYAGWSYRFAPQVEGKKLKLDVSLGHGYVPGGPYSGDKKAWEKGVSEDDAKVEWEQLVFDKSRVTGDLVPNDTIAIYMGETIPGQHRTVFVTVTPINIIGQETRDFESARYELPPSVAGKIKVRGVLLRVREGTEVGFGSDLPPHLASFPKDWKDKILKSLDVLERLPEVVIPNGEFRCPWDKFRELSFAAEIFEGSSSLIRLKFRRIGNPDTLFEGAPSSEVMILRDHAALFFLQPDPDEKRRLLLLEFESVD